MNTQLFTTSVTAARGSVVVTHGLNNKPEVMDALIGVLNSAGFHCVRVSLYQKRRADGFSPEALASRWVEDLARVYEEILERYPQQPVFNLGYSLGALVSIRLIQAHAGVRFDRMVLIAPPVALTPGASLVRHMTPLAHFGIRIPSLAPGEVRARPGTPVAEYAALLKLIQAVQASGFDETARRAPTKVFLKRRDELVSYTGVGAWLERNNLTEWVTESIPGRTGSGRTFEHLMISEASLGPVAWSQLTEGIVSHFKRCEPRSA